MEKLDNSRGAGRTDTFERAVEFGDADDVKFDLLRSHCGWKDVDFER